MSSPIKYKRVKREVASAASSPPQSDSRSNFKILDEALEHFNNAIVMCSSIQQNNQIIQEAYKEIVVAKGRSIKSSTIKEIYKSITENRANSVVFSKAKGRLNSYNLEKEE